MKFIVPERASKVQYITPMGEKLTLYSILALAHNLDRSVETVRKWDQDGTIPNTPFRHKGKRMYSEEQIMIAKRICNKHQKRVALLDKKSFAVDIFAAYKELNIRYFGEQERKKNA